jgi:hypothetical protein
MLRENMFHRQSGFWRGKSAMQESPGKRQELPSLGGLDYCVLAVLKSVGIPYQSAVQYWSTLMDMSELIWSRKI